MKLPFTIYDLRFAIGKKSSPSAAASRRAGLAGKRQSSVANPKSAEGIALVITLIMLSVTLVMAVAFLAIARRERGAVTTTTDTATARLAADAAFAQAEAQIVANILATNSAAAYDFGLLVSTNFINPLGYVANSASPTNVSYVYGDGTPLNAADLEQNIANLLYLPRAPVFVVTNLATGASDFRFYLDLNRNGKFEDTGINVANVDNLGVTNFAVPLAEVGDPQWIGILEHPDQPHGPLNPFVARYAFFAQPIGNSLDLNYIHNQTLNPGLGGADGFFRNEGVGSWELNLAAFLVDLNTNQWDTVSAPYFYGQPTGFPNTGNAFYDAFNLLTNRYAGNYNSLGVLPVNFYNALVYAGIDGYTLGNMLTNTVPPLVNVPLNGNNAPWAGSDNTNHFFVLPSELFNPAESSAAFTNRLLNSGNNVSSYDRYTFYHLLSALGSDSAPDAGKMNLNYRNVTNGVVVAGLETNFYEWTALDFFTNAADRMLRSYTTNWFASNPTNFLATYYGTVPNTYVASDGYGLTNVPFFGMTNQVPAFGLNGIPVYVFSNFVYTSAVNRLLQLAANIYDASTNQTAALGRDFPSVFRPLFRTTNGNMFITGYTNLNSSAGFGTVSGPLDLQLSAPFDAAYIAGALPNTLNLPPNDNIYGVPWIIGAKKGLPNFNEFSMENILAITRRLQLTRQTNSDPTKAPIMTGTNQMYMMSLNTSLGVELWNSYSNSYPGQVMVGLSENASIMITNDDAGFETHPGVALPMTYSTTFSYFTNFPGAGLQWSGGTGNPNPSSFVLPLNLTIPLLTNAVYRSPYANGDLTPSGFIAPCFIRTNFFNGSPTLLFETNSPNGFRLPQFGVILTNRLQVYMLALTNGAYHVIDYVHFGGPSSSFNVNSNLADGDIGDSADHAFGTGVWNTNLYGTTSPNGLTYGILNQIKISQTGANPPNEDGQWMPDPSASQFGQTIADQAAAFAQFFKPNGANTAAKLLNLGLTMNAPYSPTRYIAQYLTWQANDPLVHYLASDIAASSPNNSTIPQPGLNHYNAGQTFSALTGLNLGHLNDRYMPWGGNPTKAVYLQQYDTNQYNLAERDPLMTQPDNWDFPTNKFPNAGWLGRVHRGTPWQTVFLKSTDIVAANGLAAWQTWTGDANNFDALNSAPVQDGQLFDLFTTALNDNASRGTLSVNQKQLAAWSAVFSGVVALTNNPDPAGTNWMTIDPAGGNGTNSALWQLVSGTNGINSTRANTNLFPLGAFTHLGDVLRTPALTVNSPFLNWSNTVQQQSGISDELYEWLPQQTLGLLRLGSPRFVLYCYGQTLKPAQNGKVVSGGQNFFGLVTNYQVTAESAVRVVLRVDGATTKAPHVVVESYNVLPPD